MAPIGKTAGTGHKGNVIVIPPMGPRRRGHYEVGRPVNAALAPPIVKAGEVQAKVRREERRKLIKQRQPASSPVSATTALVPVRSVPSLHDPASRRLDANRIALFFQLSAQEMAQALGITNASLQGDASAPALQTDLNTFECIAAALLLLARTEENARDWLNLPDEQIDDKTPMALIKAGEASLIAEMLEDMLWGQPS